MRPADPIERMWVDEMVDLEWDLHRLRTTRPRVVEDVLTDQLAIKVFRCNTEVALQTQEEPPPLGDIQYCARACVRGDPEGRAYITEGLGFCGWRTNFKSHRERLLAYWRGLSRRSTPRLA